MEAREIIRQALRSTSSRSAPASSASPRPDVEHELRARILIEPSFADHEAFAILDSQRLIYERRRRRTKRWQTGLHIRLPAETVASLEQQDPSDLMSTVAHHLERTEFAPSEQSLEQLALIGEIPVPLAPSADDETLDGTSFELELNAAVTSRVAWSSAPQQWERLAQAARALIESLRADALRLRDEH